MIMGDELDVCYKTHKHLRFDTQLAASSNHAIWQN